MNALVQAALLGTARQAPPQPVLPELAASGSPEQRLLHEAAATALYREAGARPRRVHRLPEPAPDEDRPVSSQRAADHLRMILHGPYGAVLSEWLHALAAAGRVIPHEHAPTLLRYATPLHLEPVLSRRARWLAPQMGVEWATEGDLRERWETGSRATRQHLARVHPAGVAPLLVATWKQESAADRETFLELLGETLGEAFLETALDDRAQGVRAQAAILLSRLPDSAFAHRMTERLASDELPAFDESMRRDGLVPARLRRQLVEAAPLGKEPSEDPAFEAAALRQRNVAWARAIHTPALLELAGQDVAERYASKDGAPIGGAWSAPFTKQVASGDDAPPRWRTALALHGHPDVDLDPHTEAGDVLAFRRTMLEELRR